MGRSEAIEGVREQIHRLIARQGAGQRLPSVLVTGETGTGKGLIARLLHRVGPRASGPFVDVNCAAIPDTLLEAELFGYERGAFTDARQAKAGLFQTAHRGTLFLDEVGLLPEALQAKLLKAIEERVVRRLGATRGEPFDAWLLCATNEDLPTAIRERRFREDLYHRLAIITLRLPPLRERGEDVLFLAEQFLGRACADYGLPAKTLAPDARAALTSHRWPGNVRELSNVMERAALLTESSVVTGAMLSLAGRAPAAAPSAAAPVAAGAVSLDDAMRDHLLATLEQQRWNISRTADVLGISRNTVRARIARFGLREGAGAPPAPGRPAALRASAVQAPEGPREPPPAPAASPALPAGPGSIRWERRHITLLRVALEVAPSAEALLDTTRALEALVEKVGSFGGRVEEMSQSSLGVVFGLEHLEEAPRRAAHAAMAMEQALERGPHREGPLLTARVGLHVAPLLVGRTSGPPAIDADGKRAAWSAVDTLVERAALGTIVVTEALAPLLDRHFVLVPLASGALRGHRLMGPRRSALAAGRRMTTFVGRRQELELIESRFATAVTGTGHVIGIAGEAGIGKSRLLREFRQRLRGQSVTWLEAHCVAHGTNTPYLPLVDLLRRACRLADGDPPEILAEKVARALDGLGIEAARAPELLRFLGVGGANGGHGGLGHEALQARTLDLVRRMIVQASRQRPLVIAVEDLHWLDAASGSLASVIEALDRVPLLLLFTYRPGYALPWGDRSFATQIALQPLTAEESAEVVTSAVAAGAVPGTLTSLIVRQADGNPFFLEELARAVAEQGGAAPRAGIPTTIRQVLESRINRLPDEVRRLLDTVAVLGREAPYRLLAAMSEDAAGLEEALGHLVRQEFLFPTSTASGENAYVFAHALVQEHAYQNLLASERRRLHGAAGRALESVYAGRLEEVAELLAHHFGQSDLDEPAVDAAILAGEKAIRRWASLEALAAFDAAQARLAHMPDTEANRRRRIDAVLKQSEIRFALGEHAPHLRALEDLSRLVEQVEPPRRAAWLYWTGFFHSLVGTPPDVAIARCREAAAVADSAGLEDLRPFVDCCLAHVYLFSGNLSEAIAAGERALALFEARGNLWWACRTIWALSPTANARGDWAQSLEYCRRALGHAETMKDLRFRIVAWSRIGGTEAHRGDWRAALAACDQAMALGPTPYDTEMIKAVRGLGRVKQGEAKAGIEELTQAVEWFARSGLRYTRSHYSLWLAEALLRQGDGGRAREVVGEVLAASRDVGYRHLEGIACRLLGECAAREHSDEARRQLLEARAILEGVGARNEVAKTLVGEAGLRADAGESHAARALLRQALTTFQALGTLDESARVRAILTDLGARG
ncbi:MAG: sigma 54-interacting transcriptional regulator [Candidatus Rokubacteria bacterium]|nr:sigma 54-interacting transcriptional regulator [Candidatus Rokubacteria bacterium]